jgi:endonuclease YncB( thermonuclease family)
MQLTKTGLGLVLAATVVGAGIVDRFTDYNTRLFGSYEHDAQVASLVELKESSADLELKLSVAAAEIEDKDALLAQSINVADDPSAPLYERAMRQAQKDLRNKISFITYLDIEKVIDGDTIVVGGKSKRFGFIDTPEKDQMGIGDYAHLPCGQLSREYLDSLLRDAKEIVLLESCPGRYGRPISYVWADGIFVNLEMLKSGHAVSTLGKYDVHLYGMLSQFMEGAIQVLSDQLPKVKFEDPSVYRSEKRKGNR